MNPSAEFQPFPKMARLNREMVISEKIDGTNAQVFITPISKDSQDPFCIAYWYGPDASTWGLYAGSRNRWLQPGKSDNYGFAAWVLANVEELKKLGPGRHFGEWFGRGIQRNYGLTERRFSLFNVARWVSSLYSDPTRPGVFMVGKDAELGPDGAQAFELLPAGSAGGDMRPDLRLGGRLDIPDEVIGELLLGFFTVHEVLPSWSSR